MIERLQTVWRTVLPFTWNSARPEGKILRSFERAVISSIEYGVTSKCTSVLDSHYFSTRRTYICVCVWNTRYETAIDLYTQYMYSYIYIYIHLYLFNISYKIYISFIIEWGHTVSQLVEALRYKSEGRRFNSRWCHWNFSLTQSFHPHYGPGVDSASNRKE